MEAHSRLTEKAFHGSMEKFLDLTTKLQSKQVNKMGLSSLENMREADGRELLRVMLEEHLQLRGPADVGDVLEGSDSVVRSHRRERSIGIKTIFGEIAIGRMVYSKPGHRSLVPKDALIHVIEYLWKASRSFHPEGSLGGEGWVSR